MALFWVSKATENETKARAKLLSEALMGLYWMMSGLWSWDLKPAGGDGRAWNTVRNLQVPPWVPFRNASAERADWLAWPLCVYLALSPWRRRERSYLSA